MMRLVLTAIMLLLPSQLWAQTCNFSITPMVFTVDTLSGTPTDSTATLSINCTGVALAVRVCPGIGAGSGGATASARQMTSGASTLNFQLYSDSNHTAVWGANSGLPAGTPPTIDLPLLSGVGTTTVTIYGRVFTGQGAVPPGTYISNFTAADTNFIYASLGILPCPGLLLPQTAHPTFTATATINPKCNVSAQDIDFGSQGLLQTNIDATGQLTVTCTPGTTYNIGLDGGNAGAGPSGRLMSVAGRSISYNLYRDTARSLVWGTTIGTNTAGGTGTGTAQLFSVFGRVPPQTTPAAGTYKDLITVTVTY
jgi:spore coat protein U-like protein